MALVKLPMMGLDASGALGKGIVFSKWKGRNYVRKLVKPSNPKSGLQTGMRAAITFMSKNYAALSATIKGRWLAQFKKKAITGLNSQIKFNSPLVRRNLGVHQDPTLPAGAVEAAPTGVTPTAGTKSVSLVWVDSVGAADYCTFVYQSTSTGFTPSVATLVAIIAHGVQKYVAVKLTTGTPYYFVVGGCENGGTLGTLAAQVTATPT